MNPFSAGFIPYRAGIRPVTQKHIAIQREPLTGILAAVLTEPFLFGVASENFLRPGKLSDGNVDTLHLGEGKRLNRTQQSILEYRFQLSHHDLIVAGVRTTRCGIIPEGGTQVAGE
jgi:hypothetical protein